MSALVDLARRQFGEPNDRLSGRCELRWGNKGSFRVDLERDRWRDFESGEGGDAIALAQREYRCTYPAALKILGEPTAEPSALRRREDPADASARRHRAAARRRMA